MQYIRFISRKHWDRNRRRFTSLAFKPSTTNRGISVVEHECLSALSYSVCAHIRRFYAAVAGEPPIFWQFSFEILPETVHIEITPSNTGDGCHRDLMGLSDDQAKE